MNLPDIRPARGEGDLMFKAIEDIGVIVNVRL
jgi:hypothetical protein